MEFYILFGAILVLGFLSRALPYLRSQVLTGRATVVSKKLEHGRFGGKYSSSWNYLVTFRLSDGEELELYVFEHQYAQLKEGSTGTLRWEKDTMQDFIPEMEE